MPGSPNTIRFILIACGVVLVSAQAIAASDELTVGIDLPRIGRLAPRDASTIASSPWSIGCEVLDRDLAVYENYKRYLGPLGAKHARMQAGWAKTERRAGVYDWSWLDTIVDDARSQGVQPWLELSYGNPIYPGGGGPTLGDGIPSSPEALAAWDNWVRGTVRRFKDRVWEWEIWNEPDGSKKFSVHDYAAFFVRTAAIVRAEQPAAKIYALSLASRVPYAEEFLVDLKQRDQLGLIDAITFHGYPMNPDDTRLEPLRAMLRKLGLAIPLREGETGAPSTKGTSGALSAFPGSELTQAKWALRRMLAFRAQDVPFSLFLLMEFDYAGQPHTGVNTKGLLKTNPDKTVAYAKPAYFAAQNVFAIFDDDVVPVPDVTLRAHTPDKVALHGYRQRGSGNFLAAIWRNGGVPTESVQTRPTTIEITGATLTRPVVADLRTGQVYSVPQENIERVTGGIRLRQVPLYDSPILVAEESLLKLR